MSDNDSQSNVVVDYDQLQGYLDELAGKQKNISSATGDLRAALKRIIEDEGFHKAAIAQIRKIENMSDTGRADFLRTFIPMFQAMLDGKWLQEKEDLLTNGGDD